MGRKKKDLTEEMFVEAEVDDSLILPSGENKRPGVSDPAWTSFVLSFLEKDEKDEEHGYPKTDALPRLIEKLVGSIIESSSIVINSPSIDNSLTAIVSHKIIIHCFDDMVRTFTGVAEASPLNLDKPYDKYPTAIASTRAKGRACRDALKLKNTIVAEEISKVANDSDETMISTSQIYGLKSMCKRLDVNMDKFLKSKYGYFSNIKDLDRTFAQSMLSDLHKIESGDLEISEDLKGWQE